MEAHQLSEWLEKLDTYNDCHERRTAVQAIEPVLEGLARAEREILYPFLQRFLGFSEWMSEAVHAHTAFRKLIRLALITPENQKLIEVTDELRDHLHKYLVGLRHVLYPRLIQTLNRDELNELRMQLGKFWIFEEVRIRDAA